jgi:hypothetical protein
MAWCTCNIAAEFTELAGYGIISANLNASTTITLTADGLAMYGPATGNLSITAYSPLTNYLDCPGRASTSFGWTQKIDCDTEDSVLKVYFIPNGIAKAYMEGDVTEQITMTTIAGRSNYMTLEASAANGPATPALKLSHTDGYSLLYSGGPIQVTPYSGSDETTLAFMATILPVGSELYMNNFTWNYDPPDIPRVSYSFLFKYDN